MVKIIFISMIKNEDKIIDRCIKGVLSICDAICVNDTGSTDKTIEKVNEIFKGLTIPCKLYEDKWKNFGHNRTISFNNTKKFCQDLGWDLNTTYGLLLDGDMVLNVLKFNKQRLVAPGYKMIQKNNVIEYYNTRLVKLGFPWKCVGVTHEYWDGANTDTVSKEEMMISDIGDGGAKADKFDRDIRLLTEGLKEEPNNVRYVFYLAQSYKDCGKFKESIKLYKKRIQMGGWFEEVWYSYYMIGKCWLALRQDSKSEDKFEYWMNQAFKYRKARSEPLYALCRYFREVGQQVKSMHYYLLGRNIPYPKDDVLFIENAVYEKYLFDYEFTILQYYIFPNERPLGLKRCVEYLNSYGYLEESVYSNIDHYMPRLLDYGQLVKLDFPKQGDFTATSTALIKYKDEILANVRYVNYRIEPDGSYMMCENGVFKREHYVRTKNALIKFNKKFEQESNIIMMKEEVNDSLRKDTNILGFEDVRLYVDDNKLKCIGTSREYNNINDTNAMVILDYDNENNEMKNINIIVPPMPDVKECQKNWIPVDDKIIYKWHPLQIGVIKNSKLFLIKSLDTPKFFRHLRGSSNVFKYNKQNWVITHGVKFSTPRKYYHVLVILDENYKLVKYTIPFYFNKFAIEYCLGLIIEDDFMYITASQNDKDPIITKVHVKEMDKFYM